MEEKKIQYQYLTCEHLDFVPSPKHFLDGAGAINVFSRKSGKRVWKSTERARYIGCVAKHKKNGVWVFVLDRKDEDNFCLSVSKETLLIIATFIKHLEMGAIQFDEEKGELRKAL